MGTWLGAVLWFWWWLPSFLGLMVLAIGAWRQLKWRVASSAIALLLSVGLIVLWHEVGLVLVIFPLLTSLFTLPFHTLDLVHRRRELASRVAA